MTKRKSGKEFLRQTTVIVNDPEKLEGVVYLKMHKESANKACHHILNILTFIYFNILIY